MKKSFFYVVAAVNLFLGLWNLWDREWIEGFFYSTMATVFFLTPRIEKVPKLVQIGLFIAMTILGALVVGQSLRDHAAR